jgi:hypothetical protein
MTDTLHEDLRIFLVMYGLNLFITRNVLDNIFGENQSTFYVKFYKNRAVYKIMWKNIFGPEKPQKII